MINFERELENEEPLVEFEMCYLCDGFGGFDRSTDCEMYDDWITCDECNGTGHLEIC